jgi:integrase/recombinase XerD
LAWYTAERPSAILQLGVGDVYSDVERAIPREKVVFKGHTRKGDETRLAIVSRELSTKLKSHRPKFKGWLFPSLLDPLNHLGLRAMDRAFRRILVRAGMDEQGYSLYSLRRGALTTLRERGYDLRAIQTFSGHKSLSSLFRYLEVSDRQVEEMLEVL